MIFGCSLRNPTHHAETWTQPLGPKGPPWCGLWPKWLTRSSGACSSLPVVPGVEKVFLRGAPGGKALVFGSFFDLFGKAAGRAAEVLPGMVAMCTASHRRMPVLAEGSGHPRLL